MNRLGEMMRLVTDSSCDFPSRILERFQVEVVPLLVHIGGESYADSELSRESHWQKSAESEAGPQTCQPSVGASEGIFERMVSRGKQVLCVTLTGKHTGTVGAARLAAIRFGDAVRVVDSHSLSLGLGFQLLEAARARDLGHSMEDILALLKDVRSRVHALVVLETLESVRRGGRADAFIALLGRMSRVLKEKPVVNFVEGRVQLLGVARSLRRGIERIVANAEDLVPLDQLAVTHARNPVGAKALAGRLAGRLRFPRDRILVGETGAVLASHAGAGAVGVFVVSRSQSGAAL